MTAYAPVVNSLANKLRFFLGLIAGLLFGKLFGWLVICTLIFGVLLIIIYTTHRHQIKCTQESDEQLSEQELLNELRKSKTIIEELKGMKPND